jgi:hypothetical protein
MGRRQLGETQGRRLAIDRLRRRRGSLFQDREKRGRAKLRTCPSPSDERVLVLQCPLLPLLALRELRVLLAGLLFLLVKLELRRERTNRAEKNEGDRSASAAERGGLSRQGHRSGGSSLNGVWEEGPGRERDKGESTRLAYLPSIGPSRTSVSDTGSLGCDDSSGDDDHEDPTGAPT